MNPTYLYLTEADGVTKIGITNDPARRLRELQTSNATPLDNRYTIPLTYDVARKLERYLHQKYDGVRTRGEWFEISADEIWAEIELTASILRSVAASTPPAPVAQVRMIEVVRSDLPELTKGSEIINLNYMSIPHYWISFEETRAKPWVIGDDITLVNWRYRRTFDLLRTTDADVIHMVKKATADKLVTACGSNNVRLVKQQSYAPYTLLEHTAQLGHYENLRGFVKAA